MTTGDLVHAAKTVFGATIGCSQNILSVYDGKTGNPRLLGMSLKPVNVGKIVDAENHAAINGSGKSLQDRIAKLATPIRRITAHTTAQLLVTAEGGFGSRNEYSTEARNGLLGDF